jgi:NAD(P)-dependent dehydrogenase (short-subunit alcohol dehydrogenase family)
MRVFITGGSGYRAQAVVEALVAQGDDVKALVRETADASVVSDIGAEPRRGHLGERHGLENQMFVTQASFAGFGRRLTHYAAERLAGNWTMLLPNGIVLIIAGVLMSIIDWSVRSLSTFIGARSSSRASGRSPGRYRA